MTQVSDLNARLFKSEKGIFLSEKVERWDSGLDPIGFLDLVPFVGRSFVHQHIEYFKLYCDAILGNQVGFEWGSPKLGNKECQQLKKISNFVFRCATNFGSEVSN